MSLLGQGFFFFNSLWIFSFLGFPGGSDGEESACNAGDQRSIPELGRIPWRRKRLPTPVFLPGESHRQRSLAVYSPWGHKESDTTELLSTQCA